MAQPHSWLEEVTDALRELGGESHLDKIYVQIESRGIMDFAANRHWRDAVRLTLQQYSSDSLT